MCFYVVKYLLKSSTMLIGGVKIFVSNSSNTVLLVPMFNEFFLSKIGKYICV